MLSTPVYKIILNLKGIALTMDGIALKFMLIEY